MAMLLERCLAGVAGGCCALDHLGLTSTGLGPEGVLGVASWLGRAAQLVELDLLLPYTKGSHYSLRHVYEESFRIPMQRRRRYFPGACRALCSPQVRELK